MQLPQSERTICGETIEDKGEIHMCTRERGHSNGKKVAMHRCGAPCNCGRVWIGSRKSPQDGDTLKKSA